MYPDEAIFLKHPHFPVVTKNLIDRRGSKPFINIPIFQDVNTPWPFVDNFDGRVPTEYDLKNRKQGHVYLDSMPFGPSACCLQNTFQTESLDETLWLRDQLIAICPIIFSLTASTPIFRGYLVDTDTRWNTIKQALDDRTEEERGLAELEKDRYRVDVSRCDGVDNYVSPQHEEFNDFGIPYSADAYHQLMEGGVPQLFARAIAHLFIKDPIQFFKERMEQIDYNGIEFFEDFHLFHWRTLRIKLPPEDSSSGWKVEFRPSEIQATDFQNAAVSVFMFIMTRLILERKIDTVIPITMVFHNLTVAQRRNAVLKESFYFRKDFSTDYVVEAQNGYHSGNKNGNVTNGKHETTEPSPMPCGSRRRGSLDRLACLLTVNDIINGNPEKGVVGLADLAQQYVDDATEIDSPAKTKISPYIKFIRDRASGKVPTVAKWMRDFVRNHPRYRLDSVVTSEIAHDMLFTIHKAATGVEHFPGLQGNYEISL